MPVEGGAREGYPLTHVGHDPTLVDLCQRDGFGLVDGVYQPDVFLECIVYCHRYLSFSLAKIIKNIEYLCGC